MLVPVAIGASFVRNEIDQDRITLFRLIADDWRNSMNILSHQISTRQMAVPAFLRHHKRSQ